MIVLIVIANILGAILLLFLTLLAILLFVPFRFNIFVSNSSKLTIKLKASWLFRLIRVYYEKKGDKSRTKIEVFFITLGNKKKKRKKHKADKGLADQLPVEAKDEPEPQPVVVEEPKPKPEPEPELYTEEEAKPKSEPKARSKSKTEPEPQPMTDGIMARLEEARSKLDYVYNYPDREKLIRLTIKLCIDLLRALKPKSFCIKGQVGTGDPALTGQLLGAVYIVRSFTGINIDVKGDFENISLNGEVIVESNIYLYRFIIPLCKYALSRPVWKIIKKFIFRKDGKK